MSVFLDTNVLVGAFATRGICADLFRYVLAQHRLVTGEVNLEELRRVLIARLEMPARLVSAIEDLLRDHEVVPRPGECLKITVRDPDDAWVLASAVSAGVDVLVTGDRDLLDVAARSPVRIDDPRGFWEEARGAGGPDR